MLLLVWLKLVLEQHLISHLLFYGELGVQVNFFLIIDINFKFFINKMKIWFILGLIPVVSWLLLLILLPTELQNQPTIWRYKVSSFSLFNIFILYSCAVCILLVWMNRQNVYLFLAFVNIYFALIVNSKKMILTFLPESILSCILWLVSLDSLVTHSWSLLMDTCAIFWCTL